MTRTILAVALLALHCTQATAQTYEESRRACLDTDARSAGWLKACSVLITSGRENPTDLSKAYAKRGFAYGELGQLDRAIGDYDQAIKLDPTMQPGSTIEASPISKKVKVLGL
jgi:tetratricopeptide (TPR) repeat protein